MYYSTNLPIETMGFPDYDFPNRGRSFVPKEDVLEFFTAYANHYNVVEKIRFEHHVVQINPVDDKWEVSGVNIWSLQD